MRWPGYLRTMFATAVAVATVCYGFVLLVDPYDTVWFSPAAIREPVSTNQRYSFPALARADRFDSAVFGTSTTRLLVPDQLNELFDARFANLSMNSATAYEQSELHRLFVRHHPTPRVIVYGIDDVWCTVEDEAPRFTFRPFPPWLYDENRWNDLLYLFNFKAIEEAGQQFGFLTGLRARRYGPDGYTNFLPAETDYDIEQARRNIYGPAGPPPVGTAPPSGDVPSPDDVAGWTFATHALMREMLNLVADETTRIMLFVPYHAHRFAWTTPRGDMIWQECKRRLTAVAGQTANTHVLDFMIESAVTRDDANYWDVLHYSTATATLIADAIARGVASGRGEPDLFEVLVANPPH